MMNRIAEFLFETMLLKRVHRTGYQFLGPGKESVAEHTFGVMCIAWTLAELSPEAEKAACWPCVWFMTCQRPGWAT
jgi:putative hydrolase of HD superfamily